MISSLRYDKNNKTIKLQLNSLTLIQMGCGSSSGQDKLLPNSYGLILMGSTAKGPTIINFTSNKIQSFRSTVRLPKFAHAFVNATRIGYITGGVQELLSTSVELKSPQQQQYQGVISKKFYRIELLKLLTNPQSAFQQLPDMINARYAHCAVQFQGRVYVIGGREYGGDDIGLLTACERYSDKENKWKSVPSLQQPRAGAAVVVYGQHLYVFGGYTGKKQRSRVIQSYLDGDKGWRKLPYRLHEGLEGFVTIANPSNSAAFYIFGGKTNSGRCSSVVEINLDKSTVMYVKPMSESRSFHKAFIEDKVVHIIGGGADSIQAYDLADGTSSVDPQSSYLQHCNTKQLASLSALQPQVHLVSKQKPYQSPNYKNKVFIFGHSRQPFTKIIDLDTFVVLSESQNLAHSFYKFPTVSKVNKQTCFIMGGINADYTQVTDMAYSFNLLTEQIRDLQPMKTAKYGFTAVVKGSYLYLVGGRKLGGDDVAILATCERFSFESYQWESICPLKNKRHSSLVVTVGDFLIAIGGYRGNGIRSNDIEIYVQSQNRWVQVEQKFELAAQAIQHVVYQNDVYLFGGRAEQIDIVKVFKLHLSIDESKKYEKSVKASLQQVGNLTVGGTNLRVYLEKNKGLAYIFGNVKHGIDVYDLKLNKIVQNEKLPVFEYLQDQLFQSYAIVF